MWAWLESGMRNAFDETDASGARIRTTGGVGFGFGQIRGLGVGRRMAGTGGEGMA